MYLQSRRIRPRASRPQYRGLGTTLDDLAGAITRMEGSCSSPGVCRNNNPGNLRAGPGATGVDSRGIAIFPDFATGQAALLHQEQLNVDRGLTLSEFFGGKQGVYSGYAPAADANNPNQYTSNVSSWLGIASDVPLSGVLDGAPAVSSDIVLPDFTDAVLSDDSGMSPWTLGALLGLGVAALWAVS